MLPLPGRTARASRSGPLSAGLIWMGPRNARPLVRDELEQPRLLHLFRHADRELPHEIVNPGGVRRLTLSGPDQLVLLQRIDERLDRHDEVTDGLGPRSPGAVPPVAVVAAPVRTVRRIGVGRDALG